MRTPLKLVLVAALGALGCTALYQLVNARTFQLFGTLVSRVSTAEKLVALTIDDGPNEHVDEILRTFAEEQVPATFFLVGEEIARHPDAAHRLVAAGHELGNHTYSHQRMIFKDTDFIAHEVTSTDALIRAAGFEGTILFRPPYGKKLWALPRYLANTQRTTLMWSIEPESIPGIAHDAENMRRHVEESIQPGAIILMHLWAPERAASRVAIRGIVRSLKKQGYRFVKASELLAHAF